MQILIPECRSKKEFLEKFKAATEVQRAHVETSPEDANAFAKFFAEPIARQIATTSTLAEVPATRRAAAADGIALSNSDAFIAAAEKLSRERGTNILDAARELLGTWAPSAASSAQPSSPTPPAPEDDPVLVLEAERLSLEKGIHVLAAARQILHLRALDRRIVEAKKGA